MRPASASYDEGVSAVEPNSLSELVVAEDGSIPAEQLERLGLGPGVHLRVVEAHQPVRETTGLRGSLRGFPDLDWDAFERASKLARRDLTSS